MAVAGLIYNPFIQFSVLNSPIPGEDLENQLILRRYFIP